MKLHTRIQSEPSVKRKVFLIVALYVLRADIASESILLSHRAVFSNSLFGLLHIQLNIYRVTWWTEIMSAD